MAQATFTLKEVAKLTVDGGSITVELATTDSPENIKALIKAVVQMVCPIESAPAMHHKIHEELTDQLLAYPKKYKVMPVNTPHQTDRIKDLERRLKLHMDTIRDIGDLVQEELERPTITGRKYGKSL